jgi:hypothetical protein
MSVRVMTAVWALNLPANDKLVLLALADSANDEGACWPGLASLCQKTGKCRRSLQESLRALDQAGHITRKEKPGKGMNYIVHPVAGVATGSRNCTGSKKPSKPVAKSAPKPLGTVISGKAKASPRRVNRSEWVALPIGWQPTRPLSPNNQAKVAQWPPGAFEDELESFQAWAANADPIPGKGLKKDWDDAFGNWIRAQHGRHTRQQHHSNIGRGAQAVAMLNLSNDCPM